MELLGGCRNRSQAGSCDQVGQLPQAEPGDLLHQVFDLSVLVLQLNPLFLSMNHLHTEL
ncbi:hypothetical protein [Brevibacterium luteolum]|uniref:hypothetical protein n=1 Tax=Brevibacterium luteolum TaxID=199591 RepID=UPI0020B4347C|nr:hypothetical protein [Brevibacterium luteolum]